jgi:hypothetical protein
MNVGVYSGLVRAQSHSGQIAPNADAAYQSQQWPGVAAGAVVGVILAKSIFATHPIVWGVAVFGAGLVYAMSHLFECSDMQTDPTTVAACGRQGFIETMPIGAAIALIVSGLL